MSTVMSTAALLAGPVYGGYQYAYPHKTAYRPLPRPVPSSMRPPVTASM